MLEADGKPQPIHLAAAAEYLGRPWSTLRDWPRHYGSPKLGTVGRRVYYDMRDLSVIDACKNLGRPVPATYEERIALWHATRVKAPAA